MTKPIAQIKTLTFTIKSHALLTPLRM